MNLLTVGNPKTEKSRHFGYLTGILHLSPSIVSGFDTCRHATPACAAACLNTAGRGGIAGAGHTVRARGLAVEVPDNAIQAARVGRTRLFFEDRPRFMRLLATDIFRLCVKAHKLDLIPAVRLNGTSDVPWERVAVGLSAPLPTALPSPLPVRATLFELFPRLQFYDYTKYPILERRAAVAHWPGRYVLTFSLSESNDELARAALQADHAVACVVDKESKQLAMELSWSPIRGVEPGQYPVVDGDVNDLRFLDPQPSVVLLTAKGRAKQDVTGFVRRWGHT